MLSKLWRGLFPIECLHCRHEGNWLCADHQNLPPAPPDQVQFSHLDKIWAATAYQDKTVRTLIEHFKFKGFRQLAPLVSQNIYQKYPRENWRETVLVPIPLHWRRQIWRGYNQSALIAHELGQLHPGLEIHYHLLKRIKPTHQQARLDKTDRQKNLASAFVVAGKQFKNKKIILIDDVVASGSTLDSAAHCLKKAGYQNVEAIVFARSGNI